MKPGKDDLIGNEVMKQCDAEDGTEDGVIADPRRCAVDLSVLKCEAGQRDETCLTDAELEVVEKWCQGPHGIRPVSSSIRMAYRKARKDSGVVADR